MSQEEKLPKILIVEDDERLSSLNARVPDP